MSAPTGPSAHAMPPARLSPTASLLYVQPTTLCNLDCSYCYLPDRARARRMPREVADAVARGVSAWAGRHPVRVVWHGGEPLAAGIGHFEELLGAFLPAGSRHPVRHGVQTNATLIDDSWCELFVRRRVHVSVSVDGPAGRNGARADRAGRDSTERTLRGIGLLRSYGIPFTAVAVVRNPSAATADELYDWFSGLGCTSLGLNLVEQKGAWRASGTPEYGRVVEFWAALTARVQHDGRLRVRDVDDALRWVGDQLAGGDGRAGDRPHQPVPLVMWNGDVIPVGPELAGFSSPAYGRFAVGSLRTSELDEVMARAAAAPWVAEAMRGVSACRAACDHFAYCRGGNPANKYFETGRFDVTETRYCRNSRKALMDGVLLHAERT
ncbi:radical SAM protein [Streptomyces sp. WMMC500]|uniref:cyclophane-forming radical SAM peptide maturase AmcB n=1 Tax=Streptomyces sp. WMMC500 TaxID=3015154 RepID=UPI00248BF1D1|nr:cyclophane-forming radical SAM peptide maturase AmcB [Streptomyces sp. WMMC500]WBB58194.1 radical SAM protein [Streptomyces sp. WMMC500]